METISEQLKNILVKLGVEASEVQPAANLRYDLGMDSLDVAELMMEVEQQFGVYIPQQEWGKLKTVGKVRARIVAALQAPSPVATHLLPSLALSTR